ncbi:oxygen-independent coproporphyrinogen-3 oxidase [Chitinophaga terrae (ex Kim and Jung 2007)]|uniref:Heme chaperone HemW n=1 Tax=Chitinophaga terrae (ex Kim and Jung 2007) TaxID=408074 RepID=A0A1H4FA19_9BACT|nr:radical SAM family heme chaperone HemW [Chitinophaga terrae (ex Kim and Jung 2007)]SEA94154.1 oxygen-independent coproporphyrinogen-3 oxidase [Chitinophaga terrae (ex Kim and Jung 2007)]
MSGIYLHIPFCKQACYYCNFHFSTSRQHQEEMVNCILQEMEYQRQYLAGETVETIYFGGGTPSLLSETQLEKLLNRLHALYPITAEAEITLEANPDDLSADRLKSLKAAGINRLSIGVQSFREEDLRWMNRAHDSQQAINCITHAQEAGFTNITIDLIYGGPTLSDEAWEANVKRAIALGIPHLSCYALTVEPGTALDHFIAKKKMEPTDPDKAALHFELLMQWLKEAGYEHYEISNFALPGWHSRHNSSYWQGKHYLGLGPSAHSFNGHSRQWNIANNALYMKSIQAGTVPFEIESLTTSMQFNEYIMTTLRTSAGCNLEWVAEKFGKDRVLHLLAHSQPFIAAGKMERAGEALRLTTAGRLFADGIAGELFI